MNEMKKNDKLYDVLAKKLAKKMKKLYISNNEKYIEQTTKSYRTWENDKPYKHFYDYFEFDKKTGAPIVKSGVEILLTPSLDLQMIRSHLYGFTTYGVFAAEDNSQKFITFDVDSSSLEYSKHTARQLVFVLHQDFNILMKDIHVVLSGKKGYHVSLFFDKPQAGETVKHFFDSVMSHICLIKGVNIEFRPLYTQAVKLPLSIHRSTGSRSVFVDKYSFENLTLSESWDYLLKIEQVDPYVLDIIDELPVEKIQANTKENSVDQYKGYNGNSVQYEGFANALIKNGQLFEANTRHIATYSLACYAFINSYTMMEAHNLIMSILSNTPRHYFSRGTTTEFMEQEAARLISAVYTNQFPIFFNMKAEIKVCKSEIEAVLKAGTFAQTRLAFAMLLASKKFGRTFYLTINKSLELLNTKHRGTIQNAQKQLIKTGFVKQAEKTTVDKVKSKTAGHTIYKKTIFILNESIVFNENETHIIVNYDAQIDAFKNTVHALFTQNELKILTSPRKFKSHWKL